MSEHYNKLNAFRGLDFKLNDSITIHTPTLSEICDFPLNSDMGYFDMVHTLTATPTDLKVQLDDKGIDFTEISEFDLFYALIRHIYNPDLLSIIIQGVDFASMELVTNNKTKAMALYDKDKDMIFDEYTYILMTDYIRGMHKFKKNIEKPANKATKMALIEDAREAMYYNSQKERKSTLIPMISTLVNTQGFKYNYETVWDIKINHFMDAVVRFSHINNATLLLQSGYSGFGVDLKKISNDSIDYFKEL